MKLTLKLRMSCREKKTMGKTTWKDHKRVHLKAKSFARKEKGRVDLKNIRKPKEIATQKEISSMN